MEEVKKIDGKILGNPFFCIEGFVVGAKVWWNAVGSPIGTFKHKPLEPDPAAFWASAQGTTGVYVSSSGTSGTYSSGSYARELEPRACFDPLDFAGAVIVSDDRENSRVLAKLDPKVNFLAESWPSDYPQPAEFSDTLLLSYKWIMEAVKTKSFQVLGLASLDWP